MKKVLIVGANSYIGDSFARHVANDKEFQVDIVDSMNDAWKEKDFSEYDTIYHVAGIAHVSADPKLEDMYYKINRDLAIEVARHAKEKGVRQFVFMSSMIIYGKDGRVSKKKTISTGEEYAPENFYGKSKLEADLTLQKMSDESFHVVIIRTPVVYGAKCKGNFPRLISMANKLPIFPRVNNERSMVYIENLVEFIRLCVINDVVGVFYPQNAKYVSTCELIKLIRRIKGKKTWLTCLMYPFVLLASFMIGTINKVFGNKVYAKELSGTFDWQYNIVDFEESVRRSVSNK